MPAIPEAYRKDVDALPPLLHTLLDAELEAGNSIAEVHHTFPAPPIGACVMLARAVSTRPRASGDGMVFRAFNSSLHSGAFTDSTGHYFLLEPPLPPPDEPDMDAIRAAHAPKIKSREETTGDSVLDRFRASMTIDYEKWHEGIGYDLTLLEQATNGEKETIERWLTPPNGWRDVEALAALGTAEANAVLHRALKRGTVEVRTSVMSYAPWVVNDDERTATLVHALTHGDFYAGLTSALDQTAEFHPKPVVDALFRGLFVRPGGAACHYAAMLTYLHGKAESTFDWGKRPLFLRFNTDDGAERRRAFDDLCTLLELDAATVLASVGLPPNT